MVFLRDLYLDRRSSLDSLPKVIKINSKPIIPADETSLINADSLFLHYEKLYYIHFMIKSSSFIDIIIGYNNKLITNTSNTNSPGIIIENSLPRKAHILVDQLILNSVQLVMQVI